MSLSPWIAALLLALVAIPPARAEAQRPPQEAASEAPAQPPLRRVVGDEAQQRREPVRTHKHGHLSPEERLKLRQDVSEAGRDIYRKPIPARY